MKSIIKLKLSQKILREKGKIGSGYGELRQKIIIIIRNCEDLRRNGEEATLGLDFCRAW